MDRIDRILGQWNRERPDLDVTAMGEIGRYLRVARYFRREMEATFAKHGLNGATFDVLATLRRSGPPHALSPGDLMTATMVSSGTVTNRIDQLQKAGLVERRQNPADRRGFIVALTDKGFAVIEGAVADHVATQTRLISAFPAEQRATLDTLLRAYLAAVPEA